MVRLYRAHLDLRRRGDLRQPDQDGDDSETAPNDWVRDYVQAHRNHFPELDDLGEALFDDLKGVGPPFEQAAVRRLADKHNITVHIATVDVMPDWLRRYDPHRRQLRLVETLRPSSRVFAVTYLLAWLEHSDALNAIVAAAGAPNVTTQRMLKISLTNYLAAAMLMPYGPFQAAAESLKYDIGLMAARFGVGFEQACHRLTTLSRPAAKGVPFFMLRVDTAGNISKRFTSIAFPFARFGGTCPRWNIHAAFRTPGRVVTQVIETLDGARYFTLARTVERAVSNYGGAEGAALAVGIGCEIKYAPRLIYTQGMDLSAAVQVGPTCRLCDRVACRERAAPPMNVSLSVNELIKSAEPFPFSRLDV
jgi:predicted transcriptional regulator